MRGNDPQLITWAGIGLVYAGDLVGARHAIAGAVAIARDRGAIGDVAFALQVLANLELMEGRFAMAATDAGDGLALALESGEEAAAAHCRALLAWLAAVRGDPDEARAPAVEAAGQPLRLASESAHRALALVDLASGRFDEAYERLHAQFTSPLAHPARRIFIVGDLVEAAAGGQRPARDAYDELRRWADASGSPWWTAVAATAKVQLEGEDAYDEALQAHEQIALPFDRGRLELRMGELLRRRRRRTDSRRHLRAALDIFAALGAAPWERRAANELRATGETARKRVPSTLDDLTPQELQIARLVAEGATNRDIAGRLFLSPRTVDYHLRKVFQKLSVTSRTQLAALDW